MHAAPQSLLRAISLAAFALAMTFSWGCTNDHQSFCTDTTQSLCEACYRCGGSDAVGSKLCRLETETDLEGCVRVLDTVCTSNDRNYNPESGRACSERVEKLSCEQLEKDGKPEACDRLF